MPLCPDFRVARVGCSLPFGGLKGILKYEQQSWQKDAFIQGAAAERDQLNALFTIVREIVLEQS